MTPDKLPPLTPGRVYRTREFAAFTANPTRWAKRMVEKGVLRQAAHGLYYLPEQSRFGPAPPDERELLRAFLGDDNYLVTGSPIWNALGLGITGLLMVNLVYTPYRTGEFRLAGQRYWMRRTRFPRPTPLEWYVVDAFENHMMVGADVNEMERLLVKRLRSGFFDAERVREMTMIYASPATRERILRASQAEPPRRSPA